MKEPPNLAELQTSFIDIFQALTCTSYYTDYQPSAKVNTGREWEGRIGALKALSEVKCNLLQITKGTLQNIIFWIFRKVKVLRAASTLQNLVGYLRKVKDSGTVKILRKRVI